MWMLESLRDPTKHSWALSCESFPTILGYAPDVADDLRRRFGEAGIRFFHCTAEVTPPTEKDGGLLVWCQPDFPESYRGQAGVVYGHHDDAIEDPSGWPHPRVIDGRTFGLDTISRGVLTALRFLDLQEFQSARCR